VRSTMWERADRVFEGSKGSYSDDLSSSKVTVASSDEIVSTNRREPISATLTPTLIVPGGDEEEGAEVSTEEESAEEESADEESAEEDNIGPWVDLIAS
jgi:hypothetical protein